MCDDSGVCRLFLKHFGTFPPELSFPFSFERGKGKCRVRARFFHFPGYCMHALQPTCQAWRNLNAGHEQWNPQEGRRIESTEKAQFGLPSQWPYGIRPKVLAQNLFFLHRSKFPERLLANSKWSMTFSFHMTFQLLQREKIQPCFHLLATWGKFDPLHANSPLMFFTPFSCRPPADAPESCLRGCTCGVFLSINHAADIRFPSDKSLAQSVRKGGDSICLIAVDPSFCTAQPLAKQSSRGVSAQLLPAGVTMEWQNAIPGLGKKSGCRRSILWHCCRGSTPLCPGNFHN